MEPGLFRREALERNQTRWMGSISLAKRASLRTLLAAEVITAALVAIYSTFDAYMSRTRIIGQLIFSEWFATVLARATGVVSRVDMVEGDKAGASRVLAVVTILRATLANSDTAGAINVRSGCTAAGRNSHAQWGATGRRILLPRHGDAHAPTVTAYGKEDPLKSGLQFDADVMGEQRRLIKRVFEPLYSFNKRLADR